MCGSIEPYYKCWCIRKQISCRNYNSNKNPLTIQKSEVSKNWLLATCNILYGTNTYLYSFYLVKSVTPTSKSHWKQNILNNAFTDVFSLLFSFDGFLNALTCYSWHWKICCNAPKYIWKVYLPYVLSNESSVLKVSNKPSHR